MQFHKNLSNVGWEKVRERQLQRLPLVSEWISIANIKEGSSLLDIGPGPGVFLNEYTSVIGLNGRIVAVEKSQEAIKYIMQNKGQSNVSVICRDAENPFEGTLGYFDVITITDVLHHSDLPISILRNVFNHSSKETRLLIAEFDPEADGLIGPPLTNRLTKESVKTMIVEAGFEIISEGKQDYEHYFLLFKIKVR